MRRILHIIWLGLFTSLVAGSFAVSMRAQEVSIPDPGLNAAVREVLQKPIGPLTEQDLLGLTNLNASCRNVKSLAGLEAARNLLALDLRSNQLTSLTLPPGMSQLGSLLLDGNPLNTLVLSEPLAATNLAALVAALENNGISVFTYPLTVELIRLRQPIGAFQFAISGPPGAYTVLGSTNLADWSELVVLTNSVGKVVFTDGTAHLSPQKFYRTRNAP